MKRAISRCAIAIGLIGLGWVARTAQASTVVGIFAIVDRVEFEPDNIAPQRIRLSGVFVVPVPVSSGLHKPPVRGTLCFTLLPEMAEAVLRDWSSLEASAGTGQVVGFGEYWVVTARNGLSTKNTSLSVDFESCQPYPVPNRRAVVTAFDTMEDKTPRFGEPSMAIVSKLVAAHGG